MPHFITVVIYDLTYVPLLFFLFLLVSNFGRVDFGSRGSGIPGISIIPLVLMLLLLLVLPGFIGRHEILGGSRHGESLGVIPAIHCSLGLDLVCGGMGRLIFLETILISLLYVGTRS